MLSRVIILVMCLSSHLAMALQTEQSTDEQNDSDIRYVRDNLTTFIHSGPSREYRILGTIEAGTRITLLQQNAENGFSEIVDNEQRTGWIDSSSIINQRSIRDILPEVQQQLVQAKDKLDRANETNRELDQQISELSRSNKQLQERYNTLNDTYQLVVKQKDNQDQSSQKEWFTRGGIIALGGIILGVIITYIPKRKRRSDNWV